MFQVRHLVEINTLLLDLSQLYTEEINLEFEKALERRALLKIGPSGPKNILGT